MLFLSKKFGSDLIASYASQFVIIACGFLQVFIINTIFGLEVFGQLAIIIASVGIISSLTTARSSEAVTLFLKKALIKGNLQEAKSIIHFGVFVDFITATLLLILSFMTSSFLSDVFLKDDSLRTEFFLYSFSVFFGFIRGTYLGAFQAFEKFKLINFLNALGAILNIIIILAFNYYFESSLFVLVVSLVVSSMLSCVVGGGVYVYIFRDYFVDSAVYCKNLFREYLAFNLKTFTSSSLKAGNQNIESLIIGYFINSESVGLYQTLKKILSPIAILVQPFTLLIYPKMIRMIEEKKSFELSKVVSKITILVTLFCVFYLLIVYLGIDLIFSLMGIDFINVYYKYILIIGITVSLASSLWWCRIFSNTVNPIYSIYLNVFATLFQLFIVTTSVNFYGLYGAIVSLMLLQLCLFVIWSYLGARYVYQNS